MIKLRSVVTLSVFAAAAVLHAQSVTVSPAQINLSAQVNGSPVTQSLAVNSSNGAINFATFATSTNNWLSVSPNGGNTPLALTVSANPNGLAASNTPYAGSVTVFGAFGTIVVPVNLTVTAVGVTPASLSFTYQIGASLPAATSISVTGQAVGFNAAAATTTGGNWLQASPATATTPASINASLNPAVVNASMPAGTYNGTVTITPVNVSVTAAVTVPVTLTVTSAPPVTVSPSSVNINYQVGGLNNTTAQTVTLSTSGNQSLSFGFSNAVDPNPAGKIWILPVGSGTIPANGSTTVSIAYDTTSNLAAGTYNGKSTLFTPAGAPTQQDIPVKLTVSTSPVLNVPGATLAFTYQLGGQQPAAQLVTATSSAVPANSATGQLPLTFSTSTNNSSGNWLAVQAATPQTGTPFTVSVSPGGLPPGTYTGTVTVTGTGAANGPQQIPVTMTISNDPQIVASISSCSTLIQSCPMLFASQIGALTTSAKTVNVSTSTGAALNYRATAATTNCGNGWLVLGGTTAGTTNGSFTVSINPTGLAAGSQCNGSVSIAATNAVSGNAAPNSPVSIPVTLYVSNSALLLVSPSALSFTAAVGGIATPQNITVSSTSGSEQLNYTVAFASNPAGSNWLSVNTLSGSTAAGSNTIVVSVLPALLSSGTYTGSVTLTATTSAGGAVAGSPIIVPVTLQVTAGAMAVSPASLTFNQTVSGAAPGAQNLSVTSSGGTINYTVATSTGGTGNWLSATPSSGSTPGTVAVAVNGATLSQGTYTGSVTISATTSNTANSQVTVNVTLVVAPGSVSASSATLDYTQVQGGPVPSSQTVTFTTSPAGLPVNITASSTGNWLSATPSSGTGPVAVQVTANGGALVPGIYIGTVTATPAGGAGTPAAVQVRLVVAVAQTITVSPAILNFAYTVGSPQPATQAVQVSASGGTATFSAAATTSGGGNWLSISPATGTTPASVAVGVNPATLGAGNYTGTITVTSPAAISPATVTVNITVTTIPKPVINRIGNAANYATGGISAGENIVIFGTGVGPAELALGKVTNNAWDTIAGSTRVFFDAIPAPVLYARGDQTSVMVPYGVAGRTTVNVVVEYAGVQSSPVSYNILPAVPGIYTLNQAGSGQGAILNQNFAVNGVATPAAKGEVIQVYMTGEGATQPLGADGALAPTDGTGLYRPVLPVTATIGGVPATVQYYGSAPGIVYGVMQVNITIPATAPSGGSVPIQISIGDTPTQSNVTVAIQ